VIRSSGFVAGLAALLLVSCSDPAKKLPVYAKVPRFELTDSSGKPFDSSSLDGKVWVADFIYTHCPGPCPRMTSQMHRIEEQTRSKESVHFVSFTVDPARDTPPVLNEYAQRFGGPGARWSFLTGSPDTLHQLARNVFMVGDLINVMDHSTKFILVDKKARIRGFYSTFDSEGLASLLNDIHAVSRSNN
jgi:protein SCO1/2